MGDHQVIAVARRSKAAASPLALWLHQRRQALPPPGSVPGPADRGDGRARPVPRPGAIPAGLAPSRTRACARASAHKYSAPPLDAPAGEVECAKGRTGCCEAGGRSPSPAAPLRFLTVPDREHERMCATLIIGWTQRKSRHQMMALGQSWIGAMPNPSETRPSWRNRCHLLPAFSSRAHGAEIRTASVGRPLAGE